MRRSPETHRHRPIVVRSGNKCWTHWRFIASSFLRQTFVEWAGETVPHSTGPRRSMRAGARRASPTKPSCAPLLSCGYASSGAAGATPICSCDGGRFRAPLSRLLSRSCGGMGAGSAKDVPVPPSPAALRAATLYLPRMRRRLAPGAHRAIGKKRRSEAHLCGTADRPTSGPRDRGRAWVVVSTFRKSPNRCEGLEPQSARLGNPVYRALHERSP